MNEWVDGNISVIPKPVISDSLGDVALWLTFPACSAFKAERVTFILRNWG